MKKVLFLFFVVLVALSVSAQSDKFSVGTNVISGGIGVGSSIASGYTYGSENLGLNLQYERGLWEAGPGVISLGGYLGHKSYVYNDPADSYSLKWSYTIIGVRGAWHYTGLDIPNLDLYGGLMISYDALSFSDNQGTYSSNYGSTTELSVFAGARYYFTPHLAGYGELGVGVSILSLGLAVRF